MLLISKIIINNSEPFQENSQLSSKYNLSYTSIIVMLTGMYMSIILFGGGGKKKHVDFKLAMKFF